MDLATKRDKGPAEVKMPKESYPSFSVQDKHVDQLLEEHKLGMGDRIYATVCLKVTHMSADDYGKRIGFDVESIDDIEPDNDKNEAAGGEKSRDEEVAHIAQSVSQYEA